MSKDPRKIAAATIGVLQYLEAERTGAPEPGATAARVPAVPRGGHLQGGGSSWAAAGRMEIMLFRNLAQLRMLRRRS